MCAQASCSVSPLSALLLDLDYFKQINDRYGHAVGEDVLAAVAATVQRTLRASDFVGRYGGEEFIVLLPDTGRVEAEVAEKIRAAVRRGGQYASCRRATGGPDGRGASCFR